MWAACTGKYAAAQKGGNVAAIWKGLAGFWVNPIIDTSYCVSRQQCISDTALFKSRGLISGNAVCRDLILTGQIVPVKSDCVCLCGGGVICLVGGRGSRAVFASVGSEKQKGAEMGKVGKWKKCFIHYLLVISSSRGVMRNARVCLSPLCAPLTYR